MQVFLTRGLAETASLWLDVQQGDAWLRRASYLLINEEKQTARQVRYNYEQILAEMEQAPISSESLAMMLSTFRKVTSSYWSGPFHCYDIPHLPRTTTSWSSISTEPRYHKQRAAGRKQASPALVVRGAVRIATSVASRLHLLSGPEFCPSDLIRWHALRSELNYRHKARRIQYRFRKLPESYLGAFEEKLSKKRVPM